MAEAIGTKYFRNGFLQDISNFPVQFETNSLIIYEVVRLTKGRIMFLDDHLVRFFSSFQISLKQPVFSRNDVISALKSLIVENGMDTGNIKFQAVIPGISGDMDFYAFYIPHFYPTPKQYQEGVPVTLSTALRANPKAKVQHTSLRAELNRLMQDENVYEVIMVHPDGYVTEGSRSNLFMIKNDRVVTSSDDDVLPGITRKYVLKACGSIGIPIMFSRLTPSEMLTMESLFITGTSPKVLPVRNINKTFFQVNHPVLKSIMEKFDQLAEISLESGINFLEI